MVDKFRSSQVNRNMSNDDKLCYVRILLQSGIQNGQDLHQVRFRTQTLLDSKCGFGVKLRSAHRGSPRGDDRPCSQDFFHVSGHSLVSLSGLFTAPRFPVKFLPILLLALSTGRSTFLLMMLQFLQSGLEPQLQQLPLNQRSTEMILTTPTTRPRPL